MVIRVCNKDKPLFDVRMRALDLKQEAYLRWTSDCSRANWDEFVHYQSRANMVNVKAGPQFDVRSKDILMNVQCPPKWWFTLKSVVFCSSSELSLPPFIWRKGCLVCESIRNSDLLSANFNSKQCRYPVDLPSTCDQSSSLNTLTFRSWEERWLLLDLCSYGGMQ